LHCKSQYLTAAEVRFHCEIEHFLGVFENVFISGWNGLRKLPAQLAACFLILQFIVSLSDTEFLPAFFLKVPSQTIGV